jgi:hypothetical protein
MRAANWMDLLEMTVVLNLLALKQLVPSRQVYWLNITSPRSFSIMVLWLYATLWGFSPPLCQDSLEFRPRRLED